MGRWVLLLIAAAMSFAGIALAAGGGSANVTFCADKQGGDLSLGSKGKCAKGEKKVTIAKQGQPGPEGPQGVAGEDGTTASIQPEAPILVATSTGNCAASPGTFCGGAGAMTWMELPGAVGGDGGPAVSYQKDAAGYVHLTGHPWLSNGSPSADTSRIFYLPAGYRPSGDMQFAVSGCDISNPGERIRIDPDGGVVPTTACLSLDGITFHP